MNFGQGSWMGRAVGALLLLLAIAYVARYIWDLLSPMVPTLVAVIVVIVVLWLVFQVWRRWW